MATLPVAGHHWEKVAVPFASIPWGFVSRPLQATITAATAFSPSRCSVREATGCRGHFRGATHIARIGGRGEDSSCESFRPPRLKRVLMYGFYYHFNNLRFNNSKNNRYCVFETCSYLFASSETLKCRFLKWLLDHPTKCDGTALLRLA